MSDAPEPRRRPSRLATAAYAAAWLLAAAAVAAGAIAVLDDGRPEEVSLPPVRETELTDAARTAGCELRRAAPGEVVDPPVDGPAGAPAAAGFYDDAAPTPEALGAALRRGIVVVHFRASVPGDLLDALHALQAAAPTGTIVTRNATMPYEIAATAYRRLLGCTRASEDSLAALLLFRGRFIGSGPES